MAESHNWERERGVLGALIRGELDLSGLKDVLTGEHFHRPAHRNLFHRIGQVVEAGQAPTVANLLEGLSYDEISHLAGEGYLAQIEAFRSESPELDVWWTRRHAAARAGVAPNDYEQDGGVLPFRRRDG